MTDFLEKPLPAAHQSLWDELAGLVRRNELAVEDRAGSIPVDRYLSREIFDEERSSVFRRYPMIVAQSEEITEVGQYVTRDVVGLPLVLVRDREGRVRAFKNTCKHRGTTLCRKSAGRAAAFVCSYHGWTYRLDGSLKHVPHLQTFPNLKLDEMSLSEVAAEDRHGFVWVLPEPAGTSLDVQTYLGGMEEDLDSFGLRDHEVFEQAVSVRKTNWKLIVEAFLDGYHVAALHQKSVARFFHDARSISRWEGKHLRASVARKTIGDPVTGATYREATTPLVYLFPNTFLIFHPDWISRLTVFPLSVDSTRFVHTGLAPPGRLNQAGKDKLIRSWALIHGQVFSEEDLAVCESVQVGLQSGALSEVTIGGLDAPLLTFSQLVDDVRRG